MEGSSQQQSDSLVKAVREKKPVPEIDFSLHTMEDGSEVSTQERVCKGEFETALWWRATGC